MSDRIEETDAGSALPKPEVYIIKDGSAVIRPGMKTYFIDTSLSSGDEWKRNKDSDGTILTGTVCTCDIVCTCNSQRSSCSCNSNRSSGNCSCYPVH